MFKKKKNQSQEILVHQEITIGCLWEVPRNWISNAKSNEPKVDSWLVESQHLWGIFWEELSEGLSPWEEDVKVREKA